MLFKTLIIFLNIIVFTVFLIKKNDFLSLSKKKKNVLTETFWTVV